MKKFYLFLISLSFTITVSAQLIYEPFNYTPDATLGLGAQSGGYWLTINTGDSILVNAGSLNYTGLQVSTGNKAKFDGGGTDYYRDFVSQTSGSVYSSFILNVASLGSLTTTGGYFTGFIQATSTSLFGGTVWTRLSTTAGKFNVGVSARSNTTVSWLPDELDPGTSYFIVAAYEFVSGTANDVAKIWLNPTPGAAQPSPNATSAAATTDLSSTARVFLRQDNASNTPFIEFDELRVGTTWADVTPTGVVTSLSTSTLATFGNVCINTTAGPNSFTITGSNLTNAPVTVGALAGYTYSTTSGGTYTTTLSITQPGGAFSQQVFVKFTPTAVQSYNGNIPVAGGGVTTAVNVAATGAGVNSVPSLTTGSATSITSSGAVAAGTITSNGCSALTANYGIEFSTTNGFANGTGTPVVSTNLAGGNFTSTLSGLAPNTTYYYHAFATNAAGTGYGTQQQFTTATLNPTINATTLTAFGNICINTTAGPNSFTISGANLTNAPVTVAALPGYTYSTTSGGTYTTTLSLTQPGGTFTQQVFVKFTPTAVQSYNGNIVVNGGGLAAPVNVPVSGAGVNSTPTVTTNTPATGITQTTATAPGSITAAGCTSVTVYGIEYSTTNGFANGTGTPVISTNLSGTNFTSALAGLAPNTTYYYHAYATNAGGTAYGVQQSFTTLAPVLTATALAAFGDVCSNTTAGPNSFTITGVGLTNTNITVGPLAGYTFSTTSGGTYSPSLTLTQSGGAYSQQIFVKFSPTAVQAYNGNIPVSGGGATAINVAVTGNGANTAPTVSTSTASNITTNSATVAGNIPSSGCTNVTAYGIEYSGINGFVNGAGTQVAGNNLSAGSFNVNLTNLVQGATYYYRAYAINGGGISYGAQQSFVVNAIPQGFRLFPTPVERGGTLRVSMDSLITPGYYGLLFFNSAGQLVFQKDINVQVGFINQSFTIPARLPHGVYRVYFVNYKETIGIKTILIK